ncbi:hypothetical protein MEQU1_002724 [Malassezia equina]|uniref:Uncharacterized protein n=1 Tax=Malassezia equina TaxID=1381935 RepID=A0AAF0ECR5_9BASI|nr:hypothetical protein MEQU1_002724 [Malassezia equina]
MAAGLRRSSRAVRRSKADDTDVKEEDTLVLASEDAHRLVAIMDRYDTPLTDSMMPGVLDRCEGTATLRTMLNAKKVDAVEVWTCAVSLCAPTARTDARAHMGVLLFLHLLNQLVPGLREARRVQDRTHADAFALHMSLPSGDYFTNAIALPASARAALDTGAAEGVAVAPPMDAPPVYTLGDCVARTKPASKPNEPHTMRAATYLSYGAFGSSLGPSVDSSGKTLDGSTTDALYTARQRLAKQLHARWGAPLAERMTLAYRGSDLEAPPDEAPPTDEPAASAHSLAAEASALDPALDAALLAQALESLDVDRILHENQLRLEELQELQWARTRMEYAQASSVRVNEREQELANEVVASLTDLLLHVPPQAIAATARAAGPMVWVTQVVLASSLTSSSALARGFYGTLSMPLHGPKSQAQLPSGDAPNAAPVWAPLSRPSTVADNATARPGADPRGLAYAWEHVQGSPAQAVRAAMGPVMPYAQGAGRPMPTGISSPSSMPGAAPGTGLPGTRPSRAMPMSRPA